jgi:hypothetical protein
VTGEELRAALAVACADLDAGRITPADTDRLRTVARRCDWLLQTLAGATVPLRNLEDAPLQTLAETTLWLVCVMLTAPGQSSERFEATLTRVEDLYLAARAAMPSF